MTNKAKEYDTVKEFVEHVLAEDPRTREDDKWLILQVLREMNYNIYIDYEKLHEMPSFETITRCRRKLQEKGQYKPFEEVEKGREEAEEQIREKMRNE